MLTGFFFAVFHCFKSCERLKSKRVELFVLVILTLLSRLCCIKYFFDLNKIVNFVYLLVSHT